MNETNNISTISLLNNYLLTAVNMGASDIHFEPDIDYLRVRFRVDGKLHEVGREDIKTHSQIITRIKVLGQIDIGDKKAIIDGRFPIKIGGENLDIRFSIFPTMYGESAVLRILLSSQIELGLKHVGMNQSQLETFTKMINKPYGLLLVTGPNGSGKTTTLYSALNQINSIDKSIVTLEDPIEYHLPLLRQTQIDEERGVTFASGLRALLRQDPNVIMVGEIRDKETAKIAVQAAITGHLVFSSLHTNNSVGALIRLINMEVEPFLIAYAVQGVVAQRLVRKICNQCKEAYLPSPEVQNALGVKINREIYRGRGCSACQNTGYKGRVAIFEVMQITNEIRSVILQNKSVGFDKLTALAKQGGMQSLREHGLEKILAGETTPEEILLVTENY